MKTLLSIYFILSLNLLFGQATIKVEVSADTVSVNEMVEIKYTFENSNGQFRAPDMRGLPLISGPNVSSSFIIANGTKSSSQVYTYVFLPEQPGQIKIPGSSYVENGKEQPIEPVDITVVHSGQDLPQGVPTDSASKINREKRKI